MLGSLGLLGDAGDQHRSMRYRNEWGHKSQAEKPPQPGDCCQMALPSWAQALPLEPETSACLPSPFPSHPLHSNFPMAPSGVQNQTAAPSQPTW